MAAADAAGGKPRRHTIGKGPGIELDLVAAAEAFVPTSKAVREAVPALHKLGPDSHVAVVNAAVTLAKDPSQAAVVTGTLSSECGGDAAKLDLAITAITGALAVIREAAKRRIAFSKIGSTLESCNFPATFAAAAATAIAEASTAIEDAAFEGAVSLPGLQSFRWRVDVHIASSSAARVLRPSVLAELTLSDGAVHTMSMTPEQFHELRYGVAKTLKSMIDDEAHFVMRLAADMERAAKRNQAR